MTYDFTAQLTYANLVAEKLLGVTYGSVITGTFSYDTEAPQHSDYSGTSGIDYAVEYYATGTISTNQFTVSDVSASTSDADLTRVLNDDQNDGFTIADFSNTIGGVSTGRSTAGASAWQSILLERGDVFSDARLPSSLTLSDFRSARYQVFAIDPNAYVDLDGSITSLTRHTTNGVPELSPTDAASGIGLLGGAALVFNGRRKEEGADSGLN